MRFETPGEISLEDIFRQAQDLVRKGRKLKVKIPAGVKKGSQVRLRNALQLMEGQPGDILIQIKVKWKSVV